MNLCKCGCGKEVQRTFALGHNQRDAIVSRHTRQLHSLWITSNQPMNNPISIAKMKATVTGKHKKKPAIKQFVCSPCGIPFSSSGHSKRQFCQVCGSEKEVHTRCRKTAKYQLRFTKYIAKRRKLSTNPELYAERKLQLHALHEPCNVCHCPYLLSHQIDHIIPLSLGGTDDWLNLQPICYNCHLKKSGAENSKRKALNSHV